MRYLFIVSLVLGAIFSPSCVFGGFFDDVEIKGIGNPDSTFTDTFNDWDLDVLDGQGYWTGDKDYIVQSTTTYEGQGVQVLINNNYLSIARTLQGSATSTNGIISWYAKVDSRITALETFDVGVLIDTELVYLGILGFCQGSICYYNPAIDDNFSVFSTYEADTWYKFSIQYDIHSQQIRYGVNDIFTSWITYTDYFANISSFGFIDQSTETYNVYYDYLFHTIDDLDFPFHYILIFIFSVSLFLLLLDRCGYWVIDKVSSLYQNRIR